MLKKKVKLHLQNIVVTLVRWLVLFKCFSVCCKEHCKTIYKTNNMEEMVEGENDVGGRGQKEGNFLYLKINHRK